MMDFNRDNRKEHTNFIIKLLNGIKYVTLTYLVTDNIIIFPS